MRRGVYAGVGSRATPREVLTTIERLGYAYARAGYTLRTGGSPGADQEFLRGALAAGGAVELYLPWPGFEAQALAGVQARPRVSVTVTVGAERFADALAARFHPRWDALDLRARSLIARDGHQVLGRDLATPADLLLCWTPEGSEDGAGVLVEGTGQTLRIAHAHGVPAFNLRRCR